MRSNVTLAGEGNYRRQASRLTYAALGCALLLGANTPVRAGQVTFTFNPAGATPALTNSPAAFTADALSLTNYIRTTNANNLTTLQQAFSGAQLQVINGFTLAGTPVTAPGFNSAYGLYFRITPAGAFPINASGSTIGPAVYSQLDVQLVANVGHDDGGVVDLLAGDTGVLRDQVPGK